MAATIAERIRFWRLRRAVKQQDLAAHIGVSQGNISEVESGRQRRLQREPYLSQIATYLAIPVEFLHEGGPEPAVAAQQIASVSTS